MTDSVSAQELSPIPATVTPADASPAVPTPAQAPAAPAAADAQAPSAAVGDAPDRADADNNAPARQQRPGEPRRGDRRNAGGPAGAPGAGRRAPQGVPPALEALAALYPHLFGAVFLPLKRGIFQDLLAAHPEKFEREELKAALGIHTRSTRYLQSVAAGEMRHDLAGEAVEAMAPEHVHHALLEVFRRKSNNKNRANEDLLPKLRNRMMGAFEASGLTREAYTELVLSRDAATNANLEQAFAEWAVRNARDEALLRAFDASGLGLREFSEMYGLESRAVGPQLERARWLAAQAVTHAAQAADAAAAAELASAAEVPAASASSAEVQPAESVESAEATEPAAAAPSPDAAAPASGPSTAA
ncbi:MAG: ProQ/FINO family protein [Burkholderiaceae bacterium]|nr:ProQ/FINO family protein [Burkholderiaceae bacterium]